MNRIRVAAKALFPALLVVALFPAVSKADVEDCLMCHSSPSLVRVDQGARLKVLTVDESMEKQGPHYKLKCSDCHADVKKIPHEKPVKEVDCLRQCHMQEPSTNKKYSHNHVAQIVKGSAHSILDEKGEPKKHPEDYPTCKDCHGEATVFQPISYFKRLHEGFTERSLVRCISCHEDRRFIDTFYTHVSSRLNYSRTTEEIVTLCARCHEDKELNRRHELKEVVRSFKETFHGKSAIFQGKRQPDCTDCHVRAGDSIHGIRAQDDPLSSIGENNRARTCSQIDCHETAGSNLADIKVHVDARSAEAIVERYVYYFFFLLIPLVVLGVFTIMLLEQIRLLFPDFMIAAGKGTKK